MMYILKDLLENDCKLVVNCKTQNEAVDLFTKLNTFIDIKDLSNNWDIYRENTCYNIENVSYCEISWYEKLGYKIISLTEIEEFHLKYTVENLLKEIKSLPSEEYEKIIHELTKPNYNKITTKLIDYCTNNNITLLTVDYVENIATIVFEDGKHSELYFNTKSNEWEITL